MQCPTWVFWWPGALGGWGCEQTGGALCAQTPVAALGLALQAPGAESTVQRCGYGGGVGYRRDPWGRGGLAVGIPVTSSGRFFRAVTTGPSFLRSRGLLRRSATFCFSLDRNFKLGSEAA